MAKADYNVADRADFLTAAERVAETVQATPDAESLEAAHAAGVSHPAYIDYATALATHAAREDIEGLAERRAREYGDDFADADFMRFVPGQPGPGSVNGQAPVAGTPAGDEYGLIAAADADGDGIPDSTDPTPNGGV